MSVALEVINDEKSGKQVMGRAYTMSIQNFSHEELEKIFERADEQIILISPFIKLHDRFISIKIDRLNARDICILADRSKITQF